MTRLRAAIWILAVAVTGPLAVALPCRAQVAEPPAADPYQRIVWPLLEQFCVDCHAEGTAEAGIVLDTFADQEAALRSDRRAWVRVLDALENRIMPPAGKPQPSLGEFDAIIGWIENEVLRAQAAEPASPVVLRRLNRQEYDNTIRDLLGLDLGLAATFPPDEIGFGYDNVGSALGVSPIHVEKYLDAAERALDAAIELPDASGLPPIELIGLKTYPLPADAAVEFEHSLQPGRYLVNFSLVRVGIPEDVPPPRLVIGFGTDERTVATTRVQDETVVYGFWIQTFEGDGRVRVALAPGEREGPNFQRPPQRMASVSGDQRYGGQLGLHVDSMVVQGPVEIDPGSLPASQKAILFEAPGPGDSARRATAQNLIERFATRAFRRPPRPGELERLLELFDLAMVQGESFECAMQLTLTAVLASLQFLYLVEPEGVDEGVDAEPAGRPLDDYELASRLSYFLWSSMPDGALFDLARNGTLRSNLEPQVRRMLIDPKSDRFVTNFTGQWLQLRRLAGSTPDATLFPEFTETLRNAMREETERTFAHVLRQNRPTSELIDAPYTFVNETLARHYGIAGVEGDAFRQVPLADRRRGGVLTQASVLTLTSNPNRTSPVKRGQWILQQLLGTPPPPPPPDVPKLPDDAQAAGAASQRERLEIHRANPQCAACHSQMDPLGFSLENYDAIGRWRESDGSFPVDSSGELAGGLSFADARELKPMLARVGLKKFNRSLIRNMMTYALGRGLESSDFQAVELIRDRLSADDNRIQSLVLGIVESPSFQYRGRPEARPDAEPVAVTGLEEGEVGP